ncbi:PAS domain-containing protein [Labrys sp. LIt4]|uniref:PAS domain-containing protein n=1 Tax=Labrys sp. LIt4 TaxID=2821355 RepID=UPI001ADFD411|nr:PAS domain-containing protein [Labrys sp. LIt4]MBP0582050.1 PAS domain-containing protein [Labrys sp. LIt4]
MKIDAGPGSDRLDAVVLPGDVALLRHIVEQAGIAMALIGHDGRCCYANPAFCRLTGYQAADYVGMTLADLADPEDRAGLSWDGGNEDGVARRYRRHDGTVFTGLTTLSRLDAADAASPFAAIAQIVAVNAEMADETSLAETEWRWRQALEGSKQVVWDFDVPNGMVWVSPRWRTMLDLPDDERVHSIGNWLSKMHPDDRVRMAEAAGRVGLDGERDFDATYRLRHSDGHWIWVISRGRAVEYAPDGTVKRMIGTITDITRQKEMEQRLSAVSQRLEVAVQAGGIGIFHVDYPSGLRYWDARTYELHGVTPETFENTMEAFLGLLSAEDAARVDHIRRHALQSGSHYQLDYRVQDAKTGGTRYIRSTVRLIRGEDGALTQGIGVCWDVTDDVERNQRLHDTLVLLQAVMTGTPDLIYVKDRDGRYALVNPSVERLMGLSSDQILGRSDTEIFPAEMARRLIENDRHVMQSGEPSTMEETAMLDGVLRTYSSTKAPRRDERGEITGLIGISRDITDAKAAEAALRHSEMRWQFALYGSGDGVWDQNLATGEVFYSHQWKAMLGYDDDDVGNSASEWSDRVHPEDLPRCRAIIEAHLRGETADFAFENRLRAKDGTWRWIYDRGKVIERAADGRALRVIGTHTDITARKEAESAILALNQRLQLAIEAAGVGVFEYDFASQRYTWDDRLYRLYDMPRDRYDGSRQAWLDRIHPDDVAAITREYDRALRENTLFDMEFRLRDRRSGKIRHIHSLARVIRDETGAPIRTVGMDWDVTEHKELVEALFEEKERLRITLHSIGDAVISTDAQARITFMNPVAEEMTGWPGRDAAGKRLPEVFRIVDETTGETLADPVETCLARMRPYYLSDGAVLLRRDGERRSVRDSAAPVRTASGKIIGAVLVFQDVTRARILQQALEYSANHDSLTGLPNRSAFEREIRLSLEQVRKDGHRHVLCFIDLDRFKIVNDSAGHAAGDALLREVANLMRRICRPEDVPARLGGDEFALLLRDCSIVAGEAVAQRFLRDLAQLRFGWDGRSYQIGASMGLTKIDAEAPRQDELMSQADIACYTAKTSGRNQLAVYGDGQSAAHRNHKEMRVAAGIRHAVETDRFRLYAQQVFDLSGQEGGQRHFEILLRMLDDAGNIVEPAAFIPASEHYDLMGSIDRWVIHATFRRYGARLLGAHDISLSINLSANSLNDPFLWPLLQEEFTQSGLSPRRIHFEITETAVINNLAAAQQFLSKARAAGCGVMLDDFGKGLSSFTYLRQFSVDGLKIDGDFVRQMAQSEVDRAIVESINTVGHRLGAFTVAEQVENEETLALLRALGVDRAQGFALARPHPLDALF